jgi:carboxymethylenebutenolidase
MGDWIKLKADDRHILRAYAATPERKPIGGLVVVQEIFGVNKSIRRVVDEYAQAGYLTVAPSLFDRIRPNVELGYSEAEVNTAMKGYLPMLEQDKSLKDIAAACNHLQRTVQRVGVLGFCYGGLMSWLSATRSDDFGMEPQCCVGYYPGGIGKVASERVECRVMLHFGADDVQIGADQIAAVRAAHSEGDVAIHSYKDVGHAFANPDRPSYDAAAATLARQRTLAFLKANLS